MGGLTGWFDGARPFEGAERILASMSQGLNPGPSEESARQASAHAALAVSAHPKAGGACFSETHWAAISGDPKWNDPGLAAIAAAKGHAEALIEGYRRYGRDILARIGGSFVLALFDLARRMLLLAIDRMGIETLAYATPSAGAIVFGSTAEAVRRHPAVPDDLSRQGLFNYLHFYVVYAPYTIYEAQRKLLPGQFLEFRAGAVELGHYWRIPYAEDEPADAEALMAETRAALESGVRDAVTGEDIETVGAFLSGGLDSSTVSGMLAKVAGFARTFTIGFAVPGYDETGFARIAARHFDTRHTEYYVTPKDVADLLPKLGDIYDEPFGNSSVIPTYYCAKVAREAGVEVMLAGDGGDELFGGNERYTHMLRIQAYERIPRLLRRLLVEPLAMGVSWPESVSPLYKARRWIEQYRIPMPDRLHQYDMIATSQARDMFEDGFLDSVETRGAMGHLRAIYESAPSHDMLQRMMYLDLQVTLADNDLRKVAKMCGLAGVRVKFPMLDDAVVAASAKTPPSLMVKDLRLRHFFKEALSGFLPAEIISKTKHGFGLPTQHWMCEDRRLAEIVGDSLSSFRSRGILKRGFMDRIAAYRSAPPQGDEATVAWDVTVLELWLQAHRDRQVETGKARNRL